jgi:nucleoid-associated protein YgaU
LVRGQSAASGLARRSPSLPPPAPATSAPAAPAHAFTGQTVDYTIVSGDTLSTIAAAHNVTGGWVQLYTLNQALISNPDMIYPGQIIKVPA